ncbi:MAG: M43 family zinc metalloprotease [Mariniphaga sp.]
MVKSTCVLIFVIFASFKFAYTQGSESAGKKDKRQRAGYYSPEKLQPMESDESTTNTEHRIPIVDKINSNLIVFPIKFHFNTNNINDKENDQTVKALSRLNNFFKPINIQFELNGKVNLINDSLYYNFSESKAESFFDKYNYADNVINVYIFQRVKDINKNFIGGYSNFPWDKGRFIVLNETAFLDSSSLAHEIGHSFGLFHTHETFGKSDKTVELVNGTNCKTAGDCLCDTPADPGLPGQVINDKYVGTERDINGQIYNPEIHNIMSYAEPDKRYEFTQGQFNIIRYFAVTKPLNLLKKSTSFINLSEKWKVKDKLDAFYASNGHPTDKIVVFFFKDDILWCTRMKNEMETDTIISNYFSKDFTFILYDVVHNQTKRGDFLGNQTWIKRENDPVFAYILFYLSPQIVNYPSIAILDLNKYNALISIICGYQKPSELALILKKSIL